MLWLPCGRSSRGCVSGARSGQTQARPSRQSNSDLNIRKAVGETVCPLPKHKSKLELTRFGFVEKLVNTDDSSQQVQLQEGACAISSAHPRGLIPRSKEYAAVFRDAAYFCATSIELLPDAINVALQRHPAEHARHPTRPGLRRWSACSGAGELWGERRTERPIALVATVVDVAMG